MDKLKTVYASGERGPDVRADSRGFTMARGWYVQNEHGTAFGPLASEPPTIELKAESMYSITANWSDETARYHVWITFSGAAWRIEGHIYKNPLLIDGRPAPTAHPSYFPTRMLDIEAKANAHIRAAIRAYATQARLNALVDYRDTATRAAAEEENRKGRIAAIRAAVTTLQAARFDDMAAAMLDFSVAAASAAELLRQSATMAQPCQQQQARHTGVKRPQTAAYARKPAPAPTIPKAKLSALCWHGRPALAHYVMIRELDAYRGR
jgi:hypothetical protein